MITTRLSNVIIKINKIVVIRFITKFYDTNLNTLIVYGARTLLVKYHATALF